LFFHTFINILDNKISIVISRVGPIYGEGDRRSLVCDTLLVNKYFGFFPRIGNHKDMGVLQVKFFLYLLFLSKM